MVKGKQRKTGSVIFTIFLVAVILVVGIIVYIYMMGMRYIKTSSDIKFFGFVDKNDNIDNGRFWLEDGTAVNVESQKYYIVEIKGVDNGYLDSVAETLQTLRVSPSEDAIETINETIPEEFTELYPLNHFVFNNTGEGVSFYKDSMATLLKEYDYQGNPPKSGKFYAQDGVEWILLSTKADKAESGSYKDFEIVQATDSSKKYKGDIAAFLSKERIAFASLTLTNEDLIYLYPVVNISRFQYENGNNANDLYIGETQNNYFQKNGKGIYYYGQIGDICYGTFVSEEKTGKFKILFADGDRYEGDLVDSKKEGEGIWTWSNGTIYEGQFKADMKHGVGVNKFADGSVYSGDYVEDAKHGEGTYTFSNGDVYSGHFENDVFSGKGSYQWASGEYYDGDFENNVIHGEGTYYWTSGRSYTGEFENGKMIREKTK